MLPRVAINEETPKVAMTNPFTKPIPVQITRTMGTASTGCIFGRKPAVNTAPSVAIAPIERSNSFITRQIVNPAEQIPRSDIWFRIFRRLRGVGKMAGLRVVNTATRRNRPINVPNRPNVIHTALVSRAIRSLRCRGIV